MQYSTITTLGNRVRSLALPSAAEAQFVDRVCTPVLPGRVVKKHGYDVFTGPADARVVLNARRCVAGIALDSNIFTSKRWAYSLGWMVKASL